MVELLVSISIISIMSGIVFYNSPKLNRTIYLNRAAREVAFALRVAQAKSTQIKSLPGATAGNSVTPTNFSIRFIENNTDFIMFSDGIGTGLPGGDSPVCNNGVFDSVGCPLEATPGSDPSNPRLTRYSLQNGMIITALRRPDLPNPPMEVPSFNILFYRPDPTTKATTATIIGRPENCYALSATTECGNSANGPFEIDVASVNEPTLKKTIQVWLTGQISIK